MKWKIVVPLLIVCVLVTTGAYFLVFTERGGRVVLEEAVERISQDDELIYKALQGNIYDGLRLENFTINQIKYLPEGSYLKVQEFFIQLNSLNYRRAHVKITNARLNLPHSSPVVIMAEYNNQMIDVNVFSQGFSVHEIKTYLPDFKALFPLRGSLSDIDIFIDGTYRNPRVKGEGVVDEFMYKGFKLQQVPWKADVTLEDMNMEMRINGEVAFAGGALRKHKTVVKNLQGSVFFGGLWNNPRLNINGTSQIGKTSIDIRLRGTIEEPDVIVTSQPSYSKDKLLLMLATGKEWKSLQGTDTEALKAADVGKDFIDYFFFAGKENVFFKKLGLRAVTFNVSGDGFGVGAKKSVTQNLDVGYGLEQKTEEDETKRIKQKISGEYQVTDTISIGAERELEDVQPIDRSDAINDRLIEDKVYMKYEKKF